MASFVPSNFLKLMPDLQVHQEAGVQQVDGGKHLAVVTQSAVRPDSGLQPAESQLQEDPAGTWRGARRMRGFFTSAGWIHPEPGSFNPVPETPHRGLVVVVGGSLCVVSSISNSFLKSRGPQGS